MPDCTFPKKRRLLRAAEFERVFRQRCSVGNRAVVVYGARNERGYPRLGLAVSRKVGGAVVRNRWKRLLREAYRQTRHRLPPLDLVCIPRAGSKPDLPTLTQSLERLASRIEEKLQDR